MTVKTKPWEKVIAATGSYYILRLDEDKQREFNGLPDENGESTIILPEHLVEKNAADKAVGYEYVFRVEHVGDDCDLVTNENGGLTKVPPLCKVGDIVLAKGTVPKILSDPPMWCATRSNIVAILEKASE